MVSQFTLVSLPIIIHKTPFCAFTDSALAFAEILKKLEDFTLPAGDAVLEKWIAAIKAVNKHFNAGDIRAASLVAYTIIPILKGILPTIPDQIVYAAIDGLADELKQRLDHSLKVHPATLADIDEFIQSAANIMLSAMSKTTPTAETLN